MTHNLNHRPEGHTRVLRVLFFILQIAISLSFTVPTRASKLELDLLPPTDLRFYILNGEEVNSLEPIASSTVALYMPDENHRRGITNFCTGTLISPQVILTAAHCLSDIAERYLKIPIKEFTDQIQVGFGLSGTTNPHDPRIKLIKVKKTLIHPNYKIGMLGKAMGHPLPDLALLLLEREAPMGFRPVGLATDSELLQHGNEIILAGFGVTSATHRTMPKQLMKTRVKIDNPQITTAQFTYKVIDGKSACYADSGAPAYVQVANGQYLIGGVTSWGDSFCAKLGAYTSVPVFAQFIENGIQGLQAQAWEKTEAESSQERNLL